MKNIIAFKNQPIQLWSFKYFIAYFWTPFVKIWGYFVGKLIKFFFRKLALLISIKTNQQCDKFIYGQKKC